MAFEVDKTNFVYKNISREEMVQMSKEYFDKNKSEEFFEKKTMPLTKEQKEYLSNYFKNLQFSYKTDESKKDLGTYKRGAVHLLAKDDSKLKEIFDIIEKNTYPYDKPIERSWAKWYGQDSFVGLHIDPFSDPERKTLSYISSILVHKTEDLEGGNLIISGDQLEEKLSMSREFMFSLMKRLKLITFKEIGDYGCWSSRTFHGVTDVLKGERITLMVVKSSDDKIE